MSGRLHRRRRSKARRAGDVGSACQGSRRLGSEIPHQQQSGGALRIESREGVGTRITLYVSIAAEEALEQPASQSEHLAQPRAATILLIDAHDEVRETIAAQLSDLGHAVIQADGSESALSALDAHRVELIISDVAMPGVDGLELAERVRARWPHLPILFMTGHADRARLEVASVLEKPFEQGVLARSVAELLGPIDARLAERP